MESFIHQQSAVRVLFGPGVLSNVPEEVRRLGAQRALVITSSTRTTDADETVRLLGAMAVGVFANTVTHVPFGVAQEAAEASKTTGADCCVVIGGGSTIGVGKAIAHETGLPIIAIPTTYSGSEMTPVYGITRDGVKTTGRDPNVQPKTVIYDPLLTLKVPPKIAGPSGLNALAHCVAALIDREASPVVRMFADAGMNALKQALPIVVAQPDNLEARSNALYGSWLAGCALSGSRMNIHYRICHALGAGYNLPHAEVHGVMLPYTTAFNLDVSRGQEIYDLAVRVGAPTSLKAIGLPEEGVESVAKTATQTPSYNSKPVDQASVVKLIREAYVGERPR